MRKETKWERVQHSKVIQEVLWSGTQIGLTFVHSSLRIIEGKHLWQAIFSSFVDWKYQNQSVYWSGRMVVIVEGRRFLGLCGMTPQPPQPTIQSLKWSLA